MIGALGGGVKEALRGVEGIFSEILEQERTLMRMPPGGGGGHFNFICTGVCGHRIGKSTHPQTKAGTKQAHSQTIYNRN